MILNRDGYRISELGGGGGGGGGWWRAGNCNLLKSMCAQSPPPPHLIVKYGIHFLYISYIRVENRSVQIETF